MADDTITINRQDTYARSIKLKDSNNNYINATGWTIYFTVRTAVASTATVNDTDAVIAKTISGESSGIHTLTLTDSDTDIDPATYLYDIQIKKSDDTISSSEYGNFVVAGDITRST